MRINFKVQEFDFGKDPLFQIFFIHMVFVLMCQYAQSGYDLWNVNHVYLRLSTWGKKCNTQDFLTLY